MSFSLSYKLTIYGYGIDEGFAWTDSLTKSKDNLVFATKTHLLQQFTLIERRLRRREPFSSRGWLPLKLMRWVIKQFALTLRQLRLFGGGGREGAGEKEVSGCPLIAWYCVERCGWRGGWGGGGGRSGWQEKWACGSRINGNINDVG